MASKAFKRQKKNAPSDRMVIPDGIENDEFFEVGPMVPDVLYAQENHVSHLIWKDTDALGTCRVRHSTKYPPSVPPLVVEYLRISGFWGLFNIRINKYDQAMLSVFLERWRKETHTFHIRQGEITVTLQDVEVLLGLPIDGLPIIDDLGKGDDEYWATEVERLLGVKPPHGVIKGGSIKLTWIMKNVCCDLVVVDDDYFGGNDEKVQQYTRGVIMCLLGNAWFVDHSGTHMKLTYLSMISDLEKCRQYSWGSGMLALLYRELCKGSGGSAELAGPMTLLHLWAWIRFPSLSPVPRLAETDDQTLPYGYRVSSAPRRYGREVVGHNLRWFHDVLASLEENEVVWEPYIDLALSLNDLWRARVPLIHLYVIESYYPDRVMRQFGLVQPIPGHCSREEDFESHKKTGQGSTNKGWKEKVKQYVTIWENKREYIVHGETQVDGIATVPNYLGWYNLITRRYVWGKVDYPRGFRSMAKEGVMSPEMVKHCLRLHREEGYEAMVAFLRDGSKALNPAVARSLAGYSGIPEETKPSVLIAL